MLFGKVARDANLLPDADAAWDATFSNHGSVNDLCRDCVGKELQEARKRLMAAERRLRDPGEWPDLRKNYERYFLTTLDYGQTLNEILASIVLSSNGLNSDVAISVVPAETGDLKGAYGGVKTLDAEIRQKDEMSFRKIRQALRGGLEGKNLTKLGELGMVPAFIDQNTLANFRTHQETKTRQVAGDILVADNVFNPENIGKFGAIPCVTLIHEATHKYAGTIDYCYFQDDGKTPKIPEDKRFGAKWNADEKSAKWAMMNADSIAWFVYNCSEQNL